MSSLGDCPLRQGQVACRDIDGAHVLTEYGIPGVIVQGRYDMVCPPATAFALTEAWPRARLTLVPDAGHSALEPGVRTALVSAVERFRRRS